jgi:hypothetical protein
MVFESICFIVLYEVLKEKVLRVEQDFSFVTMSCSAIRLLRFYVSGFAIKTCFAVF